MESEWYDGMWALEDGGHWWYVGRRAIVEVVLRRFFAESPQRRILDVGAGEEFEWLGLFGTVTGVDKEPRVIERKRQRSTHPERLLIGSLPDRMPLVGKFDVVVALDVLEHIEDDTGALRLLHASFLEEGGYLVLTVPAHDWLWSPHDKMSGHYRRYTRSQLSRLLQQFGFRVRYFSAYQMLLFPFICVAKWLHRLRPTWVGSRVTAMPWPVVNRLFIAVMRCEAWLMQRWTLPVGAAIVVVAQKQT